MAEGIILTRRPSPILLDRFRGAAAAYSLRRISSQSTNVVRVRRSSDNAEEDFTAKEVNDGTLLAFCGSGDGFVTTWYDQSGNGNHATQTTAASQPKIVDDGVLVTENGKAALDFDGVDDSLVTANPVLTSNTWFIYMVSIWGNIFGFDTSLAQHKLGINRVVFFQSDPFTMFFNNGTSHEGVSSYSTKSARIAFSAAYENDYYLAVDNKPFEKVIENQELTPYRKLSIAALREGKNEFADIQAQEIVLYPSDQSANREAIEQNINDHYGIY